MIYINAYELDGNLYSIVKTAGGNTNGAVLINVEDGEPVETTFTVYPYDCLSSLSDNKAVAALSELLGRDASDVRKSMKRRVIMATVDDESGYTNLCASDVRKYTKTGLIRYAGMVDNPFSVAYDIIVRKAIELYRSVIGDTKPVELSDIDDIGYVNNVFEALRQLRQDANKVEKSIRKLVSYQSDVKRYSEELGIDLPMLDMADGRRMITDASSVTYLQAMCHNKRYEMRPDFLVSDVNGIANMLYNVITWQTGVKYASALDQDMLVRLAKLSTILSGTNTVHMSWTDVTIDNAVAIMLDGGVIIDPSYGKNRATKTACDVIDIDDVFRFIDVWMTSDFSNTCDLAKFITDVFSDDEYARAAMRHTGFVTRLLNEIEYVASTVGNLPVDETDVRTVVEDAGVNVSVLGPDADQLLLSSIRLIAYVKRFVDQETYDNIVSTIALAPDVWGDIDDVTYVPERHTHTRYEDYDCDDMPYLDSDDDDDYEYIEVVDDQLDEFKERLTVLAFASVSLRAKFASKHPIAIARGFMSSPADGACVMFENCVDGHGIRWDVIDAELEKDGNIDKDVRDVALELVGNDIEIYDPSYRSPYCFYPDDDVEESSNN